MFTRIIIAAIAAATVAASAASAQGYWVQDGYYDAWGYWIDTSYYVDQSANMGGGAGYYDAWGQWMPTFDYGHAANMGAIADFGASSMATYEANSAASDARQADIISGIWD